MIDMALGALFGLGVFVLVSGSTASGLTHRIAPHLRDIVTTGSSHENDDGAVKVLATITQAYAGLTRGRRQNRTRRSRVSDELAGALDLIALCVSAGMTIPAALERVAASGRGDIPQECARITAEIALGLSVSDALRASDRRFGHDGWSRVLEHLDIARRQGTPLVDILRSMADDEQTASGQRLVETASAKETLMMFPLVFVILPVTVVMAIFPGLVALGSVSIG